MIFLKRLWFKAVQQNQKGVIYLFLRLFLKLLSLFYLIIVKLRILLYQTSIIKPSKLPAYIISVGNITVGGTGKTPFVNYLSETLSKNSSEENPSGHPCAIPKKFFRDGGKVGILSRGYGTQRKQILDDESFPLPDNVVRVVAPNRIMGGTELIERHGAKTIILDDGFQHLRLKRDINFIIIDATNPFGNGWVLPGGILREPLSCLNRADIFVITHTDLVKREQLSALESKLSHYNKKIIRTIHKPQYLVLINPALATKNGMQDVSKGWVNQPPNKIVPARGGSASGTGPDGLSKRRQRDPDRLCREQQEKDCIQELSEIKGKNAWGFCGIGNPYQFHKTLEPLCNIKGFSIFPDHYYYSANDLSVLFDKAKPARPGDPLRGEHQGSSPVRDRSGGDEKVEAFITTEKDALRLHFQCETQESSSRQGQNIKIPSEIPVYYLKINIEIIGEEDIIKIMVRQTHHK